MKLYRTELDKGISKQLFDIDTNQFQLDEFNFYEVQMVITSAVS